MKYNYKALTTLSKECIAKVKNETANSLTVQTGRAASYALDMIDICRDKKIILDLGMKTEDNVAKGIVIMHQYNLSHGKSAAESREAISKMLGGYELFALCNSVSELDGIDAELVCDIGRLKIRANRPDGTYLCFDPQKEISKALEKFSFSSAGEEFYVFGTLKPFYDAFLDGFVEKL